jgi:cell division protease FtsH
MQGRRDIIEYYLSKMAHDDSLDPAVLATETVNYTPADIKYLLNEALRYALFAGRTYMTYEDFLKAQPEHEMGLRAPLKNISPEAKKRLAYYQAGHAVAVRLFLPSHRIARVTIIRQGFMMGHVSHYSARESYSGLRTKDELTDRLRVLIAGRAAEIEFCGEANQSFTALMGPPDRSHFKLLQDLLYYMTSAGMMGTMGGSMGMSGGLTPDQAKAIDDLYQRVLQETRQTLRENKHIVEALVALLLEKEELMGEEVRAFFDQYNLFTPDPTVMIGGEEVSILPPNRQQPALGGD